MDANISNFVDCRRIAVVGVSKKKFGGMIYRSLKRGGYEVYPVHPFMSVFDKDTCYPNLLSIPDGIDAAVIAVSPSVAMNVVEDAIKKGMKRLWFQQGKDFTEAAQKARDAGIEVTTKKCILMFAQPVRGVHAFHRFLARLFGRL